MKYRKQQLNSVIHEEIVKIIQREVEFPLGSLVTITGVVVNGDMSEAKVLFSVIPSNRKAEVAEILSGARNMIQSFLFKKINIFHLPKIYFEYDSVPESSANIERISIKENLN